jgi:hypothetical protein
VTNGENCSWERCQSPIRVYMLYTVLIIFASPNILALNFASGLKQSLIFLVVFMVIACGLLYHFHKCARHSDRYNCVEGLQQTDPDGRQWGLIAVTFLSTLIYLPMSTMAVHVIVWSQDLWVVPNPYLNATSFPPQVPPLGPADEYRDPLDFCWTTTMNKNEINYAPALIILSFIVCGLVGFRFLIHMDFLLMSI